MTDQSRTNQELIEEISVLKQKNKELEQAKTERKLVEESLKQSEAHYRLLADHMKDHVWIMDLNLKPTYISPSVEKSRGYTLEEIAQLPLDKHLTATSLQSAIEFFSLEMPKALADPTYYLMQSLELEFYRKDGSTFWLENMFSLIRDENGKPMSLLGVGRDITDQKQAEKARRESEELFRLLFNTINDAVFLHYGPSPDGFPGRFIEVNDIACERLGYSHDELLRMSPLDIDDPDT
ncbi:MAG: PAS domain S-box protein, partial [Syntrophus sp. (in: bacteria)]